MPKGERVLAQSKRTAPSLNCGIKSGFPVKIGGLPVQKTIYLRFSVFMKIFKCFEFGTNLKNPVVNRNRTRDFGTGFVNLVLES
jgi:hypothetical protein